MKKILFITALVTLVACSNETATTPKDSINVDSLIEISEAHIDTMSALLEEIKN